MDNIDNNVVSEFENQLMQIIHENPENEIEILRNIMLNIKRDYPNNPNMLYLVLNNPNAQIHPLEFACIFGGTSIPIARLLLEHGADINSHGTYGSTPLHSAVLSGNAKLVNFLLFRGANINEMNNNQQTPLQFAETLQAEPGNNRNRTEIIDILRKFRAAASAASARNGSSESAAFNGSGSRRKRAYKRKRTSKRKNSYKKKRRTNSK